MPSVQLLVTVITLSKPIPILLFAAWLAIFVSVILTFAPNIQQDVSSSIQAITSDISEIKELLQTQDVSAELSSKLANYAQTECQFRYCGTAIPFLTVRSTAR